MENSTALQETIVSYRLAHGKTGIRNRFLVALIRDNGCHIVISHATNCHGYSHVTVNKRTYRAHRWIYESVNGAIPDGLIVRHKCDVRNCINPEHLEIGTYDDNNRDTRERGRAGNFYKFGAENKSAVLTEDQVVEIFLSPLTNLVTAKIFDVCDATVWKIKNKKNWAHVTDKIKTA